MDILHSQLKSISHRCFAHCARLPKSIVYKCHVQGLTRHFTTFQSRVLNDWVKLAEIWHLHRLVRFGKPTFKFRPIDMCANIYSAVRMGHQIWHLHGWIWCQDVTVDDVTVELVAGKRPQMSFLFVRAPTIKLCLKPDFLFKKSQMSHDLRPPKRLWSKIMA